MSFSTITVRTNGEEIFASWFNDIRTAGISVESSITAIQTNYGMSSAGDLLTHDGSSATVLAAGTDAFVLTSNGSGVEWKAASGGGGGGLVFTAPEGKVPLEEEENSLDVWKFGDGLSQELWTAIKLPESYVAGNQVKLYGGFYSTTDSNTWLMSTLTYLVREGSDAINSTTNSHDSTNTEVTNTVASQFRKVEFDLTTDSGTINGVACSAGDIIRCKLYRGSGTTDTADIRFLPSTVEPKFT